MKITWVWLFAVKSEVHVGFPFLFHCKKINKKIELNTYVYLWQRDSMQIKTRTFSRAFSWLLFLFTSLWSENIQKHKKKTHNMTHDTFKVLFHLHVNQILVSMFMEKSSGSDIRILF